MIRTSSKLTVTLKENLIKIEGYDINYVKVGRGPHKLLFIPGVLGTIMTHYKHQIEGFDKEKFTLVIFDPIGYGKSCQLSERILDMKSYERDADTGFQLMKILNISKFSCLGWSAGGCASMILAAKYPQAVHKLVIWGANAFIHENDIKTYKFLRDLNNWNKVFKQTLIEAYGEEKLRSMVIAWLDEMISAMEVNPDVCTKFIKGITCPTLIMHGMKDIVADTSHFTFLCTNIKNTEYHLYPDGKHYIHMNDKEDFNRKVQKFLLDA